MVIKNAEFIKSAANKEQFIYDSLLQFAFVGRSNCGKSSLINLICSKKKLAKTSQTPGHTKLVNYFLVNKNHENEFILVDLPGYGYSKASKKTEDDWGTLIESYLTDNKNLKRVFVLIDCRHKPSENDQKIMSFLYFYQIPFIVVLTKIDKISKLQLSNNLQIIYSTLKLGKENILKTSSLTKKGREEVLMVIEQDLNR